MTTQRPPEARMTTDAALQRIHKGLPLVVGMFTGEGNPTIQMAHEALAFVRTYLNALEDETARLREALHILVALNDLPAETPGNWSGEWDAAWQIARDALAPGAATIPQTKEEKDA